MRKVTRVYTFTTYNVMCYKGSAVEKIGEVTIEGEPDIKKAKQKCIKNFPDFNCFLGNHEIRKSKYSMDINKFIELAEKEELTDDQEASEGE